MNVTPDPIGLARALGERGHPCRVEGRERLALITATGAWTTGSLAGPAERRAIHALATAFGFTHVALELDASPDAA